MDEPRRVWLELGVPEIVEMKQIVLDGDVADAAAFFRQSVAFTLNATQALNLALEGLLRPGDHVVTSSIEHKAVWRPLKALERRGVEVTAVSCAPDGALDPVNVEAVLRPNTRLVVMLHASNVLGTILPIGAVGLLEFRLEKTQFGQLALGTGVFDDIFEILVLAVIVVLPSFAADGSSSTACNESLTMVLTLAGVVIATGSE